MVVRESEEGKFKGNTAECLWKQKGKKMKYITGTAWWKYMSTENTSPLALSLMQFHNSCMSGYEPQGHIRQMKDLMRLQLLWNSQESQYHNEYGASLSV